MNFTTASDYITVSTWPGVPTLTAISAGALFVLTVAAVIVAASGFASEVMRRTIALAVAVVAFGGLVFMSVSVAQDRQLAQTEQDTAVVTWLEDDHEILIDAADFSGQRAEDGWDGDSMRLNAIKDGELVHIILRNGPRDTIFLDEDEFS